MPKWSEGFFEGLYQEVQLAQGSRADYVRATEQISRALALKPASRVLDVPCGDGRISLELATNGHLVTGVDITERFLKEALRESESRHLDIRWESCDMRDLPFDAEFDAAVNFGGSFGYFEEQGDRTVATSVWRALRPGGRLAIDAGTAETILPRFRERHWIAARDILVLSKNHYDHAAGRIECDWTLVAPDGRREKSHSSVRLYTYRELATLLRQAGFSRVEVFDADGLKPFGVGASRALLVATKGT